MHFITICRCFFFVFFFKSTLPGYPLIILLKENSKTIFEIAYYWCDLFIMNSLAHSFHFEIRSSWQAVFKKKIKQISYYHILINETFLLKRRKLYKMFDSLHFLSHIFLAASNLMLTHKHHWMRKEKVEDKVFIRLKIQNGRVTTTYLCHNSRDKLNIYHELKSEAFVNRTEGRDFKRNDAKTDTSDLPQPTTLNSVLTKVVCYDSFQCANCYSFFFSIVLLWTLYGVSVYKAEPLSKG